MDAAGRARAAHPAIPLAGAAIERPRRTWSIARFVGAVLAVALCVVALRVHGFMTSEVAPVPATPPTPLRALSNLRPVSITLTTPAWTKVRLEVTVDRLRTDRRLWQQMHFRDWDGVPPDIRQGALDAMLRAYREIFAGPRVWRRMDAAAWDRVPQPIRAMAYLRMVWYWARAEALGAEFGTEPETLAPTVAAIIMAESWFEHRAVNENPWGNRDLGLAQCSDYCRDTMAEMALSGEILFTPAEAEYFNPWIATRVATVWFERELLRAAGDVPLAIRAYHRGLENAMDERGDAYLDTVRRLRERYVITQQASPAWRFVTRRAATF